MSEPTLKELLEKSGLSSITKLLEEHGPKQADSDQVLPLTSENYPALVQAVKMMPDFPYADKIPEESGMIFHGSRSDTGKYWETVKQIEADSRVLI